MPFQMIQFKIIYFVHNTEERCQMKNELEGDTWETHDIFQRVCKYGSDFYANLLYKATSLEENCFFTLFHLQI